MNVTPEETVCECTGSVSMHKKSSVDAAVDGECFGLFSLSTPETFSNEGSLGITGLTISLQ